MATIYVNHIIEKNGIKFLCPEFNKNLRECERSYIIFAPLNIPDETKPWLSIIIIAPLSPHNDNLSRPTITNDMCTIEEYAIITFISLWIKHKILNNPPPINETQIIHSKYIFLLINMKSRISPYPPSFNIIPANSIEPDTGASTCALGNQEWTKNIGNLTKNVKNIINLNKFIL